MTATSAYACSFAPARGRWPAPDAPNPSLQLGVKVAFLTTASTPIAVINSIVAGATVLVRTFTASTLAAIASGVAAAVLLMAGFLAYQKWRFKLFDQVSAPA